MKPVSKLSIFITIIALIIIGWIVFTYHDRPAAPTPDDGSTPSDMVPAWPTVSVDRKTIEESNEFYTIEASYPETRESGTTEMFRAFVTGEIEQFKEDTAWVNDPTIESASTGALSLSITYREETNARANNYIFTIATYTGGAHGLQATRTFSFDQNGVPITLDTIFTDKVRGLARVAEYVQAELTKKKVSDANWIAEGAAPRDELYQNIVVTDTGLTVIFDPYSVASYAAGTQTVEVPLSVFSAFAHPELYR